MCRMRARLGEALARLAHERHRLREDDPDRVTNLNGLLVAAAREVEAVDRRDGHVDRQLDRIVRPRHALGVLHLVRELAETLTKLIRVAEEVESFASFHAMDVSEELDPTCIGPGPNFCFHARAEAISRLARRRLRWR